MFLHHLSLANFRNYLQLELELPAPVVLFQGDNGQGKTNLLEAIYFLATTRSLRAGSDRELISWKAFEEPLPFARVAGTIKKGRSDLKVEIVIRGDRAERPTSAVGEGSGSTHGGPSKRIKINGVAKRALELVGLVTVVMFSPQDLELITGSPSLRRRYLDIANCQVDPRYCRALQQYNRALIQRNHLLKQIRDGQSGQEMLDIWSDELVKSGSIILEARERSVASLNSRISYYFQHLTGTARDLKVVLRSSVGHALAGSMPAAESIDLATGPVEEEGEEARIEFHAGRFREGLRRYRRRESLQGVSLVGPHRDDLVFQADGIDLGVYGSRGEQRAVALALKLAEVGVMQMATGERPILLLDDVMSELDPSRRNLLLHTIDASGQTLVSATDFQPFSRRFLAHAALFHVEDGKATPLVPPEEAGYNSEEES